MSSMRRQEDMTLEDKSLSLEGVQYATGEEQRTNTNIAPERRRSWAKPEMMLSCEYVWW